MPTNYGGAVEYVAAVLVVLQILLAQSYLKRRCARWPWPARLALVAVLVLLWSATLVSAWLTWTGALYTRHAAPVGLATAISATGYVWIMLSSVMLAIAAVLRFLFARMPGVPSPGRRRLLRTVAVAAVGAPAAAAAYGTFI